MSILEEMAMAARSRPTRLKLAKKEGAHLVGYTGRFVPPELILAAGAIPHYICRGGEPEPPEAVLPYILRFMSPYSRAQVGYHLLGMEPVMPLLDLIAATCDDCHMSRLADMLEHFKLPTFRIGVPTDWDKQLSFDYYKRVLRLFVAALEGLTGNKVTDERLMQAVGVMNGIRKRLAEIDEMRRQHAPPISGFDFIRLGHYAFSNDPLEVTGWLDRLIKDLREATTGEQTGPRLLIAGRVVAIGDYTVPKLIEEAGGRIVAQFLDDGVWHEHCNVKAEGDLLENIARTYFRERVPPPVFQPAWDQRWEHLLKLIRDYRVDGVIWYQLSFEEVYDLECSVVTKRLSEANIPILKLESAYEYSREAMAPLVTRIESFVGSIGGTRRHS